MRTRSLGELLFFSFRFFSRVHLLLLSPRTRYLDAFSLAFSLVTGATHVRGRDQPGPPPPSPPQFAPSLLSREGHITFFPRRLASNCTYPLLRVNGSGINCVTVALFSRIDESPSYPPVVTATSHFGIALYSGNSPQCRGRLTSTPGFPLYSLQTNASLLQAPKSTCYCVFGGGQAPGFPLFHLQSNVTLLQTPTNTC